MLPSSQPSMLRNSEHGFKAGDVATTAPFGDSTSMKRKRKTGKAKSDLEEVKADSFEEDDPQDKTYELGTSQIFVSYSSNA